MSETIHCVFSTDNNFCQHLAVTLASLLTNNENHEIRAHIVYHGVTEQNLDLIRANVENFHNASLAFYPFQAERYAHFRLDYHITLASYFRLFLPDILGPEIKKVIYLDSDVVVLGNIDSLWRTPLDGNLIAAAPDLYMTDNERLGFPDDYRYFNAGVLVINLEEWRRAGLVSILTQYVEKNHAILRFHDQDALNAVLRGKVLYLDLDWNFQARTSFDVAKALGITRDKFSQFKKSPKIVHFTTQDKPWHYRPNVNFEYLYKKYLKLTPWRHYVPPDKSLKNIIRRIVLRYLPGSKNLYIRIRRLWRWEEGRQF